MSGFTDKAKAVIAAVAPTIGTALGGPFGALAGAVLAKALGVDTKDAESAVTAAIATGDPEVLLKLKTAEQDFIIKLEELGIQRDKLAFDDLANARAREVSLRDSTPKQLAWMIIGGFLVVSAAQLIAMIGWAEQVNKIPSQGWLLIGNISGYLANEAKQAAAYYFGSTIGSKEKDRDIAAIAKMP
jgi:hypothetical protein